MVTYGRVSNLKYWSFFRNSGFHESLCMKETDGLGTQVHFLPISLLSQKQWSPKMGVLTIHKTMSLVFNKKLTVQGLMYYSLPFYRSLVCGHRNRRKFYLVTCPSSLMILIILENCTNTEKKINKQTQSDFCFFLWALMKSTILESMCFRLAIW